MIVDSPFTPCHPATLPPCHLAKYTIIDINVRYKHLSTPLGTSNMATSKTNIILKSSMISHNQRPQAPESRPESKERNEYTAQQCRLFFFFFFCLSGFRAWFAPRWTPLDSTRLHQSSQRIVSLLAFSCLTDATRSGRTIVGRVKYRTEPNRLFRKSCVL